MISMDEENDNAQTEEVIQSEEKEDEQNNVQDDALTFEEMLLRCEEQVYSSCDSKKIKLATWDITATPVTQDLGPNMDCDKDSQRISRDRREHKNKEEDVMEWIHQCIKLIHSFRIIWSDIQTKK